MTALKAKIAIDNGDLNHQQLEYQKDVWQLDVIGIKPPPYVRTSHLTFMKIHPLWLRQLGKCFVQYHAATKAFYTLQQYIRSIIHFSKFLLSYDQTIMPENIDRRVMLDFIGYAHNLKQANEAKNKIITHIKQMIILAGFEGWANVTKEKIMYREDRLPVIRTKPRYIPDSVLEQLNRHIDNLPDDTRRLVLLLQHTGRRVGEICALPIDCTITDGDGDYFLRYYEFKMKKEETIPISHEMAAIINEQRSWLNIQYPTEDLKYLFTVKDLGAMTTDAIRHALNKLTKQCSIIGPDGKQWHFQPHQFRHTIGTKMINSGIPVHIVQRYLKHSSPEMTMNYAHLFDSTMKAEFAKFQGKLVDITGKVTEGHNEIDMPTELKWLKHNILAQALPNGYCGLPVQQGGCPHANACLTCSHFRTTAQFITQHKQQLQETEHILNIAEEQGWSRQADINHKLKNNLVAIITSLEE